MRVLGLDVGESKIGVALSDPDGLIAQPLEVIERKEDLKDDVDRIKKLIDDYSVKEIVVGMPLTMEGRPGPQANVILNFVTHLENGIQKSVKVWDERLTTVMVDRAMISADIKRSKRKRIVDKLAAAVILQGYLDAHRMRPKGHPAE